MGMNEVRLHGHVGKDPELKMTNSGVAFCRFSLATTETWTDKQKQKQSKTEWHSIICWGPLAERAEKYIKKGTELIVHGKIEYQTVKKDGEKPIVYTNIKMNTFEFCGKQNSNNNASIPDPEPPPEYSSDGDDESLGGGDNGDEDIPF